MNRTETLRLSSTAFYALEEAFPNALPMIYSAALEGEASHRRGDFRRYHPRAASAADCARLFAVRWTAAFALHPDTLPALAAVGRLRRDAVLAASLVAREGAPAILRALTGAGLDPAAVAELEYVKAVS